MNYSFDPKNPDAVNLQLDDGDYIEEREDNLFHIGQIYDDKVAKTLVCKHCGGNQFNVGSGNHFTAIKCITCQYEICIHDG